MQNNDPTDVWMDIENCDLPRDLDPKQMYDCIKAGLKERNYTGELTINAIFAKTTQHVTLNMVLNLSENGCRTVDMKMLTSFLIL